MADSGQSRAKQIAEKSRRQILRLQKKIVEINSVPDRSLAEEEIAKQKLTALREVESRLKQALEDANAGRETQDMAYADGAEDTVDNLVGDEEDSSSGGGVEENESPGDEGEEAADEAGDEDTGQEGPLDDIKNKAAQEGKDKAIKAAKDKLREKVVDPLKKRLGAGLAQAGRAIVAFLARYGWLVLLIIAVVAGLIMLIYWLFGGNTQKGVPGSGGSTPIMALADQDQAVVEEVKRLQAEGVLGFADGTAADLEWVSVEGTLQGNFDIRIFNTLRYLGTKWDWIQVRLARSNGPDFVRRGVEMGGVSIAQATGSSSRPLDTISAYATGQAIGIDQIGTYSDEMAAEEICAVTTDTPIDVGVQEVVSEGVLRPLYEQLAVDGRKLVERYAILSQRKLSLPTAADYQVDKSENTYVVAHRMLTLLTGNLGRLVSEGEELGLDGRAVSYFGRANSQLTIATEALRSASGEALANLWQDESVMGGPIKTGLQLMFDGMRVANMVGWYGNTEDGCKLWKAYEARQHIRQLITDLQNMATDPMFADSDKPYDGAMVPAQIIVYAVEDAALDDGLPTDVFPPGRMSVNDFGVTFVAGGDGKTDDIADEHFVGLPQDKGVFSKPGTIFIYESGRVGGAQGVLDAFTPTGAMEALQRLWDGDNLTADVGRTTKRVSFKFFVHVSF